MIPLSLMNKVLTGLVLFLLTLTLFTAQSVPANGQAQSASARNTQQSGAATAQNGAARPPTPPDYSQEAYVVEHYRQAMRFENDGSGRDQLDAQIRIVSESGVQALGQLKVGYSALSDKLDIVYVGCASPTGPSL